MVPIDVNTWHKMVPIDVNTWYKMVPIDVNNLAQNVTDEFKLPGTKWYPYIYVNNIAQNGTHRCKYLSQNDNLA